MITLTDEFKLHILAGLFTPGGISLAGTSSPFVKKRSGKMVIRFDELVVHRRGPAYWAVDIRWKGRTAAALSHSIHVDEGGSISFKCLNGEIPFSLEVK